MSYQLLSEPKANPKVAKGERLYSDYLTGIQHLLPSNLSGYNVCPYAKIAQCEIGCLNTAGRGGIVKHGETTNNIQRARLRRTLLFAEDKERYFETLIADITRLEKYAKRRNKTLCIRLNGTSDIQWEHQRYNGKTIFEMFPHVIFYDYTKIPTRSVEHIPNYHLTWSYSGANKAYANLFDSVMQNPNYNGIAVVFRTSKLPLTFNGVRVIDGDKYDMRFKDPKNVIVGLKAKGKAKHDYSGFVVD